MHFELIFIGKTADSYLSEGIEIFRKRLVHYTEAKITIITPGAGQSLQKIVMDEAAKIMGKINNSDFVIVLDENGKEYSSMEFAQYLQKIMNLSVKKIVFICGSAYGLHESVKKRANIVLSFSRFTFTHQMIRLLIVEQLYRAMTIIKGEKYHHQ